jgi:acetoin utilization protein AcuA
MPDSFTRYARYSPIISRKESLLAAAALPDANIVLAATEARQIVGYSILRYPFGDERWIRVGPRMVMEVAVIEVNRQWRGVGLARPMLGLLVDHPLEARRIFYMVGYSWTWDLEGAGISAGQYRQMMIRLFASQGFRTFQTNEPNVMMRPENLFMARIGAEISPEVEKRFKLVRFNLL